MPPNLCYMCTAAATSDEHVPPRCLFPEEKDLPLGVDLRKQLITVPSCDIHNTGKSKDDEYLLYALLLNIPNNETAKNHFFTKVQRAIQRNRSLITTFTQRQKPVLAKDTLTGQFHRTVAVQINEKRLKTSLEMIGRALYFHHFRTSWHGDVSAYPNFLLWLTEPNAAELNEPVATMAAAAEDLFQFEPRYGANPEIFCYQVAKGRAPVEMIMFLRIYEGSRVTLLFKNGG